MRRALIFLLLLCLAACGRDPVIQSHTYVFGTLVDISIYGESESRAQALTGHIQQEFQRLHNSLHAWQPNSDLAKLNDAFALGKSIKVSPELAHLIIEATLISERSHGLFNPAIGHLIQTWGFQRDEFVSVKPNIDELKRWVSANPQMHDIRIEGNVAVSRNPAVRLDFGGYAKGYALDIAARYLRQQKVQGALINIGGNIIAIGQHGDRPWRVGIQHPRQPGPIATLDLPDGWAIGTSGDYQRYFEAEGQRYCHIIDPRTGWPARDVQAVTVLIPKGENAGTMSDAVSKPLFISGVAGWREMAREMKVDNALLIDSRGVIHATPEMRKKLRMEDAHAQLED